MIDLSTTYMGLELASPLVASASPLTKKLDGVRALEDGGASAIVMHSLYEEEIAFDQLAHDHFLDFGSEAFAEALDYVPFPQTSPGPEQYLDLIREAKAAVDVPVIGSLNGDTTGGWTRYATMIEEAGADALELNVFLLASDPDVPGSEVEAHALDVVREVCARTSIPVAVKISTFWSSILDVARRLDRAGADALVLFNRFYQPDIDLEAFEVLPRLTLSTPESSRIAVRWIGMLDGHLDADMALTSGVHDAQGVLKGIAAGATVTMMTSQILRHGPGRFAEIEADVRAWLEEKEYASVTQLRGALSRRGSRDEEAFVRANYKATLDAWRPSARGIDRFGRR